MFREMRRKRQLLSEAETVAVMERGTAGVLALLDQDGYTYAVLLSYVYDRAEKRIFFHSATSGHKLEAIAHHQKVSFCVIDQDQIVPEELTTYFRSAIAFGEIYAVTDEAAKVAALKLLGAKYLPSDPVRVMQSVEKSLAAVTILAMTVEKLSGKEAIELVRAKAAKGR